MSWTWYLANDMQFFLVALLIMYVYVRSARAGGGLALVLTLVLAPAARRHSDGA